MGRGILNHANRGIYGRGIYGFFGGVYEEGYFKMWSAAAHSIYTRICVVWCVGLLYKIQARNYMSRALQKIKKNQKILKIRDFR